jgi:hypothetical protein
MVKECGKDEEAAQAKAKLQMTRFFFSYLFNHNVRLRLAVTIGALRLAPLHCSWLDGGGFNRVDIQPA